MSKKRPVPRLDLAPKLKRPLSLWNPLDYLRLLYWVFFFPQALHWYIDTFGDRYISEQKMNSLKQLKLLPQNPIHLQLLVQGLLMIIIMGLPINIFTEGIDIFYWIGFLYIVVLGMVIRMLRERLRGVPIGLSISVPIVVFRGVAIDAIGQMAREVLIDVVTGVVGVMAIGAIGGVAISVTRGIVIGVIGTTIGVAIGVSRSVASLRPENWLIGSLIDLRSLQDGRLFRLLPRVTILPLPYLSYRLTNWLRQDWEIGVHNANQLLQYTLQYIPVIEAVNQELARLPPEQLIFRMTQLAEDPFDWQLVRFASASLSAAIKARAVNGFFFFLGPWRESLQSRFATEPRLDTPARAAAAGFWYLHEKMPTKAAEAFAVVRSLPYGEEIFVLAQTLAVFHEAKDPATISTIQVPAFPNEPLLRPTSWNAMNGLRRVVEDRRVVQRSVSRSTRSFALNRALGELTHILDQSDTLLKAEAGLIVDIAQAWQATLLNMAGEVGKVSITQRVTIPYIIGDPVEGNLFVGREDILRQLEELWVMSPQLQSVVLFGHRRMGKTSILRNVANYGGAQVRVIYVNLQRLGDISQVGEVLIAISDEIATALQLPPPEDKAMLELPERNFERYLKKVVAEIDLQGVIIALDEFEIIEELISAGKITSGFMGYLRGLVQMSSKIAFAFAGLHTLEEMTADYFQPFFASVIPIRVGFLTAGSTRQLLGNPGEDFPLDYHRSALDQIYALTAGQPYLVQLIGFQLVRRYNDQVFELGRTRDPVFTVEDVEAVINDDLFARGRYYFTGVWGQAAQGPSGQQDIIRAIVPHREGLNLEEIARHTNLDHSSIQPALETLRRHDVVAEKEGRWYIIVELFRRWVLNME